MIAFANPFMLWAMAGMGIPFAIHLLSRKPAGIVYAGSLRHLPFSFSKQFQGVRLNEIPLLLLRMALIFILTLIASGLTWNDSSTSAKWLLFEKGLEKNNSTQLLRDSLVKAGYEERYLAPGFPLLPGSPQLLNNYWELAEALGRSPVSDAVIVYRQHTVSFHGHRPALPAHQRWIPIGDSSQSYPLMAHRSQPDDSIRVRIGHSTSAETYFASTTIAPDPARSYFKLIENSGDSIRISPFREIQIHLIATAAFENDRAIIVAALRALEANTSVHFTVDANRADSHGWLIWLSESPIAVADSARTILFQQLPVSKLLTRTGPSAWLITRHLTTADALAGNFTLALGRVLLPEQPYDTIIARHDERQLQQMAWDENADETGQPASTTPASKNADGFLLLIFLALLSGERMLSWKRNQ